MRAHPLFDLITQRLHGGRNLVVLTGAGISAESGIPTFRGDDGFWTRGSRNYRPEELATWATFVAEPEVVWPWYLWRLACCRGSQPNAGHRALVAMDSLLQDQFLRVTQNVDGLHSRAGSPENRTFHIHGNLERMRCADACSTRTWAVPAALRTFSKGDSIQPDDAPHLRCPTCGGWARPHVLWFDECYDERWFRFDSTMRAAAAAEVLVIVGGSGSTNLPIQMATNALNTGALVVELNVAESGFTPYAEASDGGLVTGPSGTTLPQLLAALRESMALHGG